MKKKLILLVLLSLLCFSLFAACGGGDDEPNIYAVTLTSGTGYIAEPVQGFSSPVTNGGDFKFTVTLDAGYNKSKITVKANGTALTGASGVYTVSNITEDIAVTVEGVEINTYTVTLPISAGYVAAAVQGFSSPVTHGGEYKFTVTLNAAYDWSTITVKANGTALTDEDGVYTASNITENQNITVDGVQINAYIVTFDKQQGTGGSNSVRAVYGSKMPAATAPTKTSYSFSGYFAEENGGGTKYYNADMSSAKNWDIEGDTTLFAAWEIRTEGLKYTAINSGAAYEISGLGTATDADIIIPSIHNGKPVIAISDWAFYECTGLKSVVIGNNITIIGMYAFYGSNMTNIIIPDSVISVGESAFEDCAGLKSVVIGNSVTTIGDYVFGECTNLESVVIGNSVTIIGDYAFYLCADLTNINIPSSVKTISERAFAFCDSLTSIIIPDSVTTIGATTFYSCNSLTIYTEKSSKPDEWNSRWNESNRPVVWGCTLSEDKSYVESFEKTEDSIEFSTAANGIKAPYREGYAFGGWATELGGTIVAYTASNVYAAPNGTTLYAIWIKN